MAALPPLSLYAHFPWCVRKCPYCDFNSHASKGPVPEERYVETLLRDLDLALPAVRGRRIETIFFGGGTPSLFSPSALRTLLDGIRGASVVAADAEITMEANPGTIERGRFSDYAAAGITRVSLGAQSFNQRHLQVLGRIHSAEDTRRAVAELKAAGLGNFNLDLMYGLPDQKQPEALADLRMAIGLGPTHISHYQLTLEPGTAFFHAPPPLPPDDETWEMQVECQALLAANAYQQYEVSAYARPGMQSRHNLNYWEFGDYVGIGAGAHGKITRSEPFGIDRTVRPRMPTQYMSAIERREPPETSAIAPEQLPFEFLLNTMRLREGFQGELFESRTGLTLQNLEPGLGRALERGLLIRKEGSGWRCSDLGYRFLNNLIEEFLPGKPATGCRAYTQAPTMEPATKRCD